MKICIVTVYNNECCGSFLQAFALKNTIEKLGCTVSFYQLDKKGSAHSLLFHFIEDLKRIAKFKFPEIIIDIQRYKAFCKAQKIFNVINKKSEEFDKIDCFVIGSDTVWNLEKKKFRDKENLFFGLEFPKKEIITFAVSVANTSAEKFINNKKAIEGARKMKDVSVRDIATYKIAKDVFKVNPTLVCDPTFLLDKEDYNDLIQNYSVLENQPILIYYYGNLPKTTTNRIKELKKATRKQIISFGQYRAWCDINLPFDPYKFIQCYRDCSFVITNTFHGTIFSLIYEKNFADYGQEKKKIKSLLSSTEAEKAFALTDEDLLPFFENRLDYNMINKKIEEQKNTSIQFLKRNLNK